MHSVYFVKCGVHYVPLRHRKASHPAEYNTSDDGFY